MLLFSCRSGDSRNDRNLAATKAFTIVAEVAFFTAVRQGRFRLVRVKLAYGAPFANDGQKRQSPRQSVAVIGGALAGRTENHNQKKQQAAQHMLHHTLHRERH